MRFIATWEGSRDRAYNDAASPPNCTVGVGHLLHAGPCSEEELARVWTEEEILALLGRDVAGAAGAVRGLGVHLTVPQGDALCDFVFNCGPGSIGVGSGIRRVLDAGQYGLVPGEMGQWVHAGGIVLEGLVRRRAADGLLFAHGIYEDN